MISGGDRVEHLHPAARREELRGDVDVAGHVLGRTHPEEAADREWEVEEIRHRQGGSRREPVAERDAEQRERDAADEQGHAERSRRHAAMAAS